MKPFGSSYVLEVERKAKSKQIRFSGWPVIYELIIDYMLHRQHTCFILIQSTRFLTAVHSSFENTFLIDFDVIEN